MPTVRTFGTEALPILVTLTDHDINPDVTVAPAGMVRFTVMNKGDEPHDFLILPLALDAERPGSRSQTPTLTAPATAPGDSTDIEVELAAGTYEIASSDIASADARAELTVQPAERFEDSAREPGGPGHGAEADPTLPSETAAQDTRPLEEQRPVVDAQRDA